ncbi:MAG: hypothetical protein IPF66_18315 [Holophagales bacterium]|nr:hypothetical protein [Holophagales bacterium]
MHLTNGKHAFVVIGRKPGGPIRRGGATAVRPGAHPWRSGRLQAKWGCSTATAVFGVE